MQQNLKYSRRPVGLALLLKNSPKIVKSNFRKSFTVFCVLAHRLCVPSFVRIGKTVGSAVIWTASTQTWLTHTHSAFWHISFFSFFDLISIAFWQVNKDACACTINCTGCKPKNTMKTARKRLCQLRVDCKQMKTPTSERRRRVNRRKYRKYWMKK